MGKLGQQGKCWPGTTSPISGYLVNIDYARDFILEDSRAGTFCLALSTLYYI